MKTIRLGFYVITVLSVWAAGGMQSVSARCTLVSLSHTFPLDQLLVTPHEIPDLDASLPLGSILADVFAHESGSHSLTCLPTIGSRRFTLLGTAAAYGSVLSGIPGIGMKLIGPEGLAMPYVTPESTSTLHHNSASYHLQLIKIGDMPQNGVLPEHLFEMHIPPHNDVLVVRARVITPIQVTVRRVPTCLIERQDIDVGFLGGDLGSVPGPVLQAVNFGIQLRCDGGSSGVRAPLFVTLTDAVTPGNRTDTLTLAPASTAAGVGVRVLFSGTPVLFGPYIAGSASRVRMSSAGNGLHTIPLTAELVKTGAVRMGSFNASSTFTIDYK